MSKLCFFLIVIALSLSSMWGCRQTVTRSMGDDEIEITFLSKTTIGDTDGDGFSDTEDCAILDPERWRYIPYKYRFINVVGESRTMAFVEAPGSTCSGQALPFGFRNEIRNCDKITNKIYYCRPLGYSVPRNQNPGGNNGSGDGSGSAW